MDVIDPSVSSTALLIHYQYGTDIQLSSSAEKIELIFYGVVFPKCIKVPN